MDKIIIRIDGGIITSVKNNTIPVEVRDYDIDGLDDSMLSYDDSGVAYYKYTEDFNHE